MWVVHDNIDFSDALYTSKHIFYHFAFLFVYLTLFIIVYENAYAYCTLDTPRFKKRLFVINQIFRVLHYFLQHTFKATFIH